MNLQTYIFFFPYLHIACPTLLNVIGNTWHRYSSVVFICSAVNYSYLSTVDIFYTRVFRLTKCSQHWAKCLSIWSCIALLRNYVVLVPGCLFCLPIFTFHFFYVWLLSRVHSILPCNAVMQSPFTLCVYRTCPYKSYTCLSAGFTCLYIFSFS